MTLMLQQFKLEVKSASLFKLCWWAAPCSRALMLPGLKRTNQMNGTMYGMEQLSSMAVGELSKSPGRW